jgi:hypothetical protein
MTPLRLVVFIFAAAFSAFAVWYFTAWANYAAIAAGNMILNASIPMGSGKKVQVPSGFGVYAEKGSVSVAGGASYAGRVVIADYTCVVIANETWYSHRCGPLNATGLAPGWYKVAVVRYPSLARDFAQTALSTAPLALIFILALVVAFVYTKRR